MLACCPPGKSSLLSVCGTQVGEIISYVEKKQKVGKEGGGRR